jgi:hypothetical protein
MDRPSQFPVLFFLVGLSRSMFIATNVTWCLYTRWTTPPPPPKLSTINGRLWINLSVNFQIKSFVAQPLSDTAASTYLTHPPLRLSEPWFRMGAVNWHIKNHEWLWNAILHYFNLTKTFLSWQSGMTPCERDCLQGSTFFTWTKIPVLFCTAVYKLCNFQTILLQLDHRLHYRFLTGTVTISRLAPLRSIQPIKM